MSALRLLTLLAVVAAATACRTPAGPVTLTSAEQEDLTGYIAIYQSCVAQAAASIDDGQSAAVRVAGMALAYCEPERQDVSAFLDSTQLSSSDKARYIRNLLDGATDRSAMILRHLRNGANGRWPGSLDV